MSRRLAFAAPHLTLDLGRAPFFGGADERDGVTEVPCPHCGALVHVNAQRFSVRAECWHDALPETLQEAVSALFGLRREDRTERWPGRLPLGRRPFIGPLRCVACKAVQLACVALHEQQPGLYVATLQGLARSVDDGDEGAMTPLIPIDGLRLALPLADGEVLLDFLLDGPRRLDADAIPILAPGFFRGEPGLSSLDGMRGVDGEWLDADALLARSVRPAGLDPNAFVLTLARQMLDPSDDSPAFEAFAVHWAPLKRGPSLRMEEAYGGGFFLRRDQGDYALAAVARASSFRELVVDGGAGWVLEAVDAAQDGEAIVHRLSNAVVARGLHLEPARRLPWPPPPLPSPSSDAAPGWWNDASGEATQFIVDALDDEALVAALATVVTRMRERRALEDVGTENRLSIIAMEKFRRLELCWVDPLAHASFGTRRYALAPRAFAAGASADALEYAAERWATALAADPTFNDLRIHHRFEFAGRWVELEAPEHPAAPPPGTRT
ncbi:MAG: hypothetical protein ACRC2H_09420 [Silanimonas sp.]